MNIGIDGCRSGWCVCLLGSDTKEVKLYRTIAEVFDDHPEAERVFIDIPMGLSDKDFHRTIDSEIRVLLKPYKHQSVFTPPCREALDVAGYREALSINRNITGKGISIQSWNLSPKIRELDLLLHNQPLLRDKIYESHPETCFYFLNREKVITSSKKTEEGIKDRLHLLNEFEPETEDVFKQAMKAYQRKEMAADDIVDALCLSVSATLSGKLGIHLIRDRANTDSHHIPLRIAAAKPF